MIKNLEITRRGFVSLVTFCLIAWLCLFVDRLFLFHDIDKIILLVAKLVYIPHFFIVLVAIKIYKNANEKNKNILFWFALANIGLLLNDMSWYFVTYFYFNITHISFLPFLLNLIPFFTWVVAITIFAYKILNQHVLQIKSRVKTLSTLAIINLAIIGLFLFSIDYASAVFSLTNISQIFTFIAQVVAYDFIILCLIYSESKGLAFFLSGIIILISGDFFIVYSTISQTTNLYFYGELLWLLGLLFNLFGCLMIHNNANYSVKDWVRRDNTIKSKLVFWCFSISVMSFLLFFIVAYFFCIIGKKEFLGLPLFIMIYSTIIIVLSLYMGKYFEYPFKQIMRNIRILMLKDSTNKVYSNFSIEEFVFLQEFITDAFAYRARQEKEQLKFERERTIQEIERVQAQTALKEEQLKLENQINETKILQLKNEAFQITVTEQEKFKKIVGQVAHDIRSPISTLQTLVQTTEELPEQKRITLRRAIINIEDITNHMLTHYKPEESILTENNQRQYVLVSVILAEIISERRYRYQNSPIQFELIINNPQVNNFVFIQIEPSNLRRMLSNIINNSIEALPEEGGKVILTLKSTNEWIEIEVADNGKGIPFEALHNLRQKIAIKTSKKGGFGIGLTQVFDVVESNYGEFEIYSTDVGENHGTAVSIKFPKSKAPNWLAHEINIAPDDIIIIVDDDTSIHGAWDSRINYIVEKFPTIEVKHFIDGKEALDFIDVVSSSKDHICLLSDYELLNQNINGLDIIEQSGVKRAILVTSHYTNPQVREDANKIGVKILAKELAHSIPLKIKRPKYKPGEIANVHMVFVDDEPELVEGIIIDYYSHLIIDFYINPIELLKEIDRYPKDTKIIMDINYQDGNEVCPIGGYKLAEMLHEKGYTKLYMYSWESSNYVPQYVTFILKTDRETIAQLGHL